MGLQDRDYMRERNADYRTKHQRHWSLRKRLQVWVIVLFVVTTLYVIA
jgi:membrane protein required for beta-lactamase induction